MMENRVLLTRISILLIIFLLSGCFPEAPEPTVSPAEVAPEQVVAATAEESAGGQVESCTDQESGASLNYAVALTIAQNSACTAEGQLADNHFCNEVTGTWWIDLNIDRPGCLPACVVDVNDGKADINWRCTGALLPEGEGELVAEPSAPTAEPVVATFRDVSFQGISFSYDDRLAAEVVPRSVPAEEFLMIEGAVIPGHDEFIFVDYVLPETFHEPRLKIYPVDEFAAGNELTPPIFERQNQLLAAKPDKPEGSIPFLPLFNAGPLMQTQIKYLAFQNGEGVRYLTQFGQAYLPISNRAMFYTFQGLTGDGDYYVSLVLPVRHPSLPPNEAEIPGGDEDAFVNNFEAYARGVEEQLNTQDDATFIPDISLLDALVQSLFINKEPSEAAANYDYAGWQRYNNDAYGYTFMHPATTTVRETEGDIGPAVYSSLVGGESWPIVSVNHYISDFYRPAAGTDVRQWVLDYGIPHDAINTEITIGGLPAVRLITEPASGSYGFDEYYVIKDEQLFRILIWPSDGNQDWEQYEQFLASFTFQ